MLKYLMGFVMFSLIFTVVLDEALASKKHGSKKSKIIDSSSASRAATPSNGLISSLSGSSNMNPKLGNLSTAISFDGSAVHGKYQQSMDGAATVEDDKYLHDLLSVRSSFRDRIEAEKSRY